MSKCSKCGADVDDNVKFCPACGASLAEESKPNDSTSAFDSFKKMSEDVKDETGEMNQEDIEKNKTMGGLAYFLFFLPLVSCPDSKYGRFHANQGLLLLLAFIAAIIVDTIISAILTTISWRLWTIANLFTLVIYIPITVVGILGLVNGFSGKAKELPFIGKYRIIK